ncbi:hypothetical protein HMPREF9554_01268 [Treponema phagedenis F0421]|nr:hypothetical protein HMPREF9554_01268 [Treponema phagedenis F0421]
MIENCVRRTEGGEHFVKSAKPDPFCAPKIAQKEPQAIAGARSTPPLSAVLTKN